MTTKRLAKWALVPKGGTDRPMAVLPDAIHTGLVECDDEMQVALELADGSAVVLSFAQVAMIAKAWKDWAGLVFAERPRDAPGKTLVASMDVAKQPA